MPAAVLAVYVSPDLRDRTRQLAKELHVPCTVIIREGLIARVEELEAKIAAERARRAAERERKQSRRRETQPLAPVPSLLDLGHGRVSDGETPSRARLNRIVADHAQRIALAEGDEIRRLVQAAIRKVKKECPLTHPSDDEMVRLLEEELARLRDEGPTEVRDVASLADKPAPLKEP